MHPRYFFPPKVLRQHYHSFYWRSIRSSVKRLQRQFVPDLVMGYWLHPDGAAAVAASQHFRVPSVMVSGGSDLRLLTKVPSRRRAIQAVLASTDRLVVVSKDLAGYAAGCGISADKIDVVYRGVDHCCFRVQDKRIARTAIQVHEDAVVVMWSGRLEPVKNPRMLLLAAVDWKREWGDKLKVIIAGDGSMKAELLNLRSELDLEGCVRFDGNLRQSDLSLRYSAADVMVLTSLSEGIPNVLLEAIACGASFVATDVGGVSEIATSGVDRLVPSEDMKALAEAVIRQVMFPPNGQRRFVPDGMDTMASRFNDVFLRVLADGGGR